MINEDSTEWWWIDYLEDELAPDLDQDLRALLEHSAEDRQSFESFRVLREWLRASDPFSAEDIRGAAERVNSNVMRAITAEESRPRVYSLNVDTKNLSV